MAASIPLIVPGWTPLRRSIFSWIRTLEKIVCSVQVPLLAGPVIYIASDCGGAHKSCLYDVLSFLYVDMKPSELWEHQRRGIRERYLLDGRRMSFKGLNDAVRRRALVPFLDAANSIHGLALSVAVRKSITNLCTDEEFFQHCVQTLDLDPSWRLDTFERMIRTVTLASALIGGLSRPGQNIYWISDEDDIFANTRRSTDVKKMMDRFSSSYVSQPLGEVGLGTTAVDEGDRLDEDLNAIPDLMSGAVAELTTCVASRFGGRIPSTVAVECDLNISPKADLIFSWISDNVYSLRRAVMVIDRRAEGGLAAFKFEMAR
jgi:hypothetical protein